MAIALDTTGCSVIPVGKGLTPLGEYYLWCDHRAGTFKTVKEAQAKVCPEHHTFSPDPGAQQVYTQLYPLFRELYFAFGEPGGSQFFRVIPKLIRASETAGKTTLPAD